MSVTKIFLVSFKYEISHEPMNDDFTKEIDLHFS